MAAIQTTRKGQNYVENIIDSRLMFGGINDWSVTQGTGSGVNSSDYSFVGGQSLKVRNDTPAVDLELTNPNQSTIIKQDGMYQFSFKVFKTQDLAVLSGKVQVFLNGNPFKTEAFSIGSEDGNEDVFQTNLWINFVADTQYSLNAGDEITFTISSAGSGIALSTVIFYIDGMFLHKSSDRLNSFPPKFNIPFSLQNLDNVSIIKQWSEWAGITLDSKRLYVVADDLIYNGTPVIEGSDGSTVIGLGTNISSITNSDFPNQAMFVSDVSGSGGITVRDLTIESSAVGSQVANLIASNISARFNISNVVFRNCQKIATIEGFGGGIESLILKDGGDPVIEFKGTWNKNWDSQNVTFENTLNSRLDAYYKAGSGFLAKGEFNFSNITADLGDTSSLCDFTPAQIENTSALVFDDCLITREGLRNTNDSNITPNISSGDVKCAWRNNRGMPITIERGRITLTSEVETVVPSANVFTELEGVFSADLLEHFDSPTNNALRHIGQDPRDYQLNGYIVLRGVANDEVFLRLRIDRASGGTDYTPVVSATINSLQGGRNVAIISVFSFIELDQFDSVLLEVTTDTGSNLTGELGARTTLFRV